MKMWQYNCLVHASIHEKVYSKSGQKCECIVCYSKMYLYLFIGNWIQNVVSQLIWKMYEQLVFRLNPTSKFLAWHFICCNMLSLPSEVSFQSNHQINYFVSDSHRQIFFSKNESRQFWNSAIEEGSMVKWNFRYFIKFRKEASIKCETTVEVYSTLWSFVTPLSWIITQ